MEMSRAVEIIEALMDGHDPYTGEVFEKASVYQNPDTVRALATALDLMKTRARHGHQRKGAPENAGKPWTEEETALLLEEFGKGVKMEAMAQNHGRTRYAILSKLDQLGKMQY
jgi:hypothetical protein